MLGKKLQKFAWTSLTKAQTAKGKDANLSASFVLEVMCNAVPNDRKLI